MTATNIRVLSREGGEFDCYVAAPDSAGTVPAVVLASAVHGVDEDIREIADQLAARGCIAAAPDLFWRSVPGPLAQDDPRAGERSQPRLERIRAGEADMADTLQERRKNVSFNGQALAMGFCYGGPYAIIGPKRLGYAAGLSCHGTRMIDYIGELEGLARPVCLVWGDQDHTAPPEVLQAYRKLASRMANVKVHVFPGVVHSYMMRSNPKVFDEAARDFSMRQALAMIDALRAPDRNQR